MSCSETPCADCHAGCCRAFAVPITGADVIRIERSGFEFWEFACRWADPNGEIARNYAPQIRFADEPETPFVLCLLQQESQTYPGTGRCRFLDESMGKDVGPACTVYGARPAACRAFPTKFDTSRELVELHPVFDPPAAAQNEAYKLCPRPWTPSDIDGIKAAQTLAAAQYESEFFRKVVHLWNRTPGEWTAFPNFLRIVYSSRVRVESPSAVSDNVDGPILLPIEEYRPLHRESSTEEKRAAG